MSALTDLFTSMANKIRNKTGGSDTYTPAEMVSDGIDDVYDAGYQAGGGSVTLDGDAAVGNVLIGKTFYNNSTTKQTGTMWNNRAVSQSLDCGNSYTIPEGYHNGSGTVSANSLASQTGVDSGKYAVSSDEMLIGCQGWVNGQKVTGTFEPDTVNNTAMSTQLGDRTIYPDPGKFFNSFTVKQFPREYVIPTHIIPSDANPVNIDVGDAVTPDIAGYVYASNTAVVPSGNKSLGTYTTNGSKSASCAGYATVSWTNNVSFSPTEETLWTNSASTSSFAEQTITLNSGKKFSGHTYIKITWKYATTDSTSSSILIPLASLQTSGTATGTNEIAFGVRGSSANLVRLIRYTSDTQLFIAKAAQLSGTSTNNNNVIPTSITGITF